MELSPSNANEFLARFQNFDDGLVRSVHVRFSREQDSRPGGVPRGVVILLSAIDQTSTWNEGWVNVTLDIEAVSEVTLIEGKSTSVVLSRGLSVGFFDGKVFLAVDTEAESLDEFRSSDFFVAGERCTWAMSEYSDSE